jgi:hypothetical protein
MLKEMSCGRIDSALVERRDKVIRNSTIEAEAWRAAIPTQVEYAC